MNRIVAVSLWLGMLTHVLAIEWRTISPSPTSEDFIAVAANDGVFVAAGANLWTSTNSGRDWRLTEPVKDGLFTGIIYADGRFVATRRDSICASTNGVTWTSQPLPGFWNTLTFGNGRFVAGGGSGEVATSLDGISWQVTPGVGQRGLGLSAYGNGLFLLVEGPEIATIPGPPGPGGFPGLASSLSRFWVLTSTDGSNWTRTEAVTPYPTVCFLGCQQLFGARGLVFANGRFVLNNQLNPGAACLSSSDGMNWRLEATPLAIGSLYFEQGNFIQLHNYITSFAGTPQISVSQNLSAWAPQSVPLNDLATKSVAFDGSTYVVVGSSGLILRGPALDALERIDSPEKTATILGIAVHGDSIFAIGRLPNQYFHILSTNAGRTFDRIRDSSTLNGVTLPTEQVRYADGKFVAVGAGIKISTNGLDWRFALYDPSRTLYDVNYGNGLWVAVGQSGTILTSTNGIDFTDRSAAVSPDLFSTPLNGVAYGAGKWVAVRASGVILESNDGVAWTVDATEPRPGFSSVAFGNGKFVACGGGNHVYISSPAGWVAKEVVPSSINFALGRIAFANGIFAAIVPGTNKTYVSSDGETWALVNTPGVGLAGISASDGRLWASGANAMIFEAAPTLALFTGLRSNGQFILEFDSPSPANFRIYSAANSAAESFAPLDLLVNVSGRVSWTNSNNTTPARFFLLKQE